MNEVLNKKKWVSPQFISEGLEKTNSGASTAAFETFASPSSVTYYAPIS